VETATKITPAETKDTNNNVRKTMMTRITRDDSEQYLKFFPRGKKDDKF